MGVEIARGRYDSRGRWRRAYVYMLVAYDVCCADFAFIKFGHSRDAYARATGLRTACPLQWIRYTIIECSRLQEARTLEAALLRHFSMYRCSGEWIKVEWLKKEMQRQILKDVAAVVKLHIRVPVITEVDPIAIVAAQHIKDHVNARGALKDHPYRRRHSTCTPPQSVPS